MGSQPLQARNAVAQEKVVAAPVAEAKAKVEPKPKEVAPVVEASWSQGVVPTSGAHHGFLPWDPTPKATRSTLNGKMING